MVFNFERYFYSSFYLLTTSLFKYTESLFSTLIFNIFIYTFTLILLFIFFSFNSISRLKYTNLFSLFSAIPSVRFFFLLSFFSLCGIPPLAGFFAKLYILINLFHRASYFIIFIFFCFNLFAMYFYLQNTKFFINDSKTKIFNINKFSYSLNLSFISITVSMVIILALAGIYADIIFMALKSFTI